VLGRVVKSAEEEGAETSKRKPFIWFFGSLLRSLFSLFHELARREPTQLTGWLPRSASAAELAMSGGDKKDTGEDPYANSGARFGRLELPAFDARSLDLGAIAPLYGVQSEHEADYLDYNIKGRDWFEKCTYNCGLGYLGGIISGGVYGAVEGNR
jgi:hypothetical protein